MGYRSIADKAEEIRHRKLDLADDSNPAEISPHRPELSVWAECELGEHRPTVTLGISALWGQPQRFVDLTPEEARILANNLIQTAKAIDDIVDNHEPPDPPGFEAGFASNH